MICLSFHLNERACVESSSAKKDTQTASCQVALVVVTATMQKQVRAQLVLGRFTYST